MKKQCFLALTLIAVTGLFLLNFSPQNGTTKSYSNEELCGCCYLTDVNASKIIGRKFAVLVLEFEEGLSRKDIMKFKKTCKLILAYINFGYAEEWVHEPTEYEGEYFVEFWREEWLQVVLIKIEKAREMGFDGVFLDNIDSCIVISELKPEWARNLNFNKAHGKYIA